MSKQNTKTKIQEAFKSIICQQSTSKINVKIITEQAHIHRKTFYLHYTSIDDLYEDILQQLAQEYAEKVDQLTPPFSYYDLTRILFEYCDQNKVAEILFTDPRYSSLLSVLNAQNRNPQSSDRQSL